MAITTAGTSAATRTSAAPIQPSASDLLQPLPMSATFSGTFDGHGTAYCAFHKLNPVRDTSKLVFDFKGFFAANTHSQSLGVNAFAFKIGAKSKLLLPEVVEPASSITLQPLIMTGSVQNNVVFTRQEWPFDPCFKPGSGYEGNISWKKDPYDDSIIRHIKSVNGYMKLRKVWDGPDGRALYQGFWEVRVRYDLSLKRRGWSWGKDYRRSFWAIEKLRIGDYNTAEPYGDVLQRLNMMNFDDDLCLTDEFDSTSDEDGWETDDI